jgi:hypothetical protein
MGLHGAGTQVDVTASPLREREAVGVLCVVT